MTYVSFHSSPLSPLCLFLSLSLSVPLPLQNLPGWRSVFDPTSWYTHCCQTHCAELTHVIRWVNPIQSDPLAPRKIRSIHLLNPGCFCLILSATFLLKLVSSLELLNTSQMMMTVVFVCVCTFATDDTLAWPLKLYLTVSQKVILTTSLCFYVFVLYFLF